MRRSSTLLPLAACILAALACTRSDVPAPGGIGAGLAAAPTEFEPSETAEPEARQAMVDTAVPTASATETPEEPEPLASPTFPPTPTIVAEQSAETVLYRAQPGDVLRSVAVRFGVLPTDIISSDGQALQEGGLLAAKQILFIPRRLGPTGPAEVLLPDSELIFSPHAIDFNLEGFVAQRDGYLSRYRETVGGRTRTGAQVVALAARDHSINPRLLLALLEYHAGWVTQPETPFGDDYRYPLGHAALNAQGLYRQLTWAANELGSGYYGWRAGTLIELAFPDSSESGRPGSSSESGRSGSSSESGRPGSSSESGRPGSSSVVRLAPELNAGTVALQYYFSLTLPGRDWAEAVSADGFIQTYRQLFGDPFEYTHPIYDDGLQQPEMILPFIKGRIWAFTGGPHGAWEAESAWAALDFAPSALQTGCVDSEDWVLAAAPGLVVRAENGVVVLDLDGDGEEQSGWSLLYLHIGKAPLVKVGDLVEQGDFIGHPSCLGGTASGTHVHIARKYNGEWMLADGPLPFTLSGWVARAGARPYQGALVRGDEVVLACTCASQATYISR